MHVLIVIACLCVVAAAQVQTDMVAGTPLTGGPDPAVVAAALAKMPRVDDPRGVNMLAITTAQAIIDHNMVLTPGNEEDCHRIPEGLDYFEGVACIPFKKVGPTPINTMPTPLLRAFFVYGSGERGEALRDGDYLLVDKYNMPMRAGVLNVTVDGENPDIQFAVGDPRGGETSFLTAIHTVFVRRHNQLINLGYSFEEAKLILENEVDKIIFEELLPALIGPYASCDEVPNVDQVDKSFSGAIFRIHSMINDAVIDRLSLYGVDSLRDVFFDPTPIENLNGNLEPLIRSMYKTPAFADNAAMVDTLNRFLFHPLAHSLAVLNLVRGQDFELSDFNSARVAVGLAPYLTFAEFVDTPQVLEMLEALYPGGPNTCPIWLCTRAEKNVEGSSMGETASTWIRGQLCGLRRPLDTPLRTPDSFSTILCQTTNACDFKDNPFLGTGSDTSTLYSLIVIALVLLTIAGATFL